MDENKIGYFLFSITVFMLFLTYLCVDLLYNKFATYRMFFP